jgi:uncharacterized membrane protein
MSILYCGDTDLSGAASYLAGLMTLWGWEYDYVPSHVPLSCAHIEQPRSLYVFSDYPAMQVTEELQRPIIEQVRAGTGLLMIGGWESFCGQGGTGGAWDASELGRILPVQIRNRDDRVNSFRPAALVPTDQCFLGGSPAEHPILRGIPWENEPPFVGGWNDVAYRCGKELLTIERFIVVRLDSILEAENNGVYPGLVVDDFGSGRVAAFMSDVAPHWVGGFVDWGDARVTAQAPGASAIEVGNWYAQFWRQLLSWTARIS